LKGSLRHIVVLAVVATIGLVASGATGAATQRICKPKTSHKCRCASKRARRTRRCNRKPVARFTFTAAEAGSASEFDASASRDPDGKIVRYSWSFGTTGVTASHTWDASGTYLVKLTVRDNRGATASITKSVVVPQKSNSQPIASFTFTAAVAGMPSEFDASASSDPDGTIVQYSWSFGATGVTASHTWTASGTYPVELTVTDDRGATATMTASVVVPANRGTLTITPSVPADRAALIRDGYTIGQSYLPKIGAPSNWRVDVYAAGSVPEMQSIYQGLGYDPSDVPRYMPDGGGAFQSHGDHVFIVPAGASYDSSSTVRRTVNPIHEMWHTVQYALAPNMFTPGPDDMPTDGPVWLREGSAEFVGYSGVADSGIDASSYRGEMLSMAKGPYASVALQDTATQSAQSSVGYATYDLGFFATELLTKTNGMASLTAYWAKIGTGTPWRDAFQQAFGRTVDQFYTEFASYRASL
jgi:PKD repeat protein